MPDSEKPDTDNELKLYEALLTVERLMNELKLNDHVFFAFHSAAIEICEELKEKPKM